MRRLFMSALALVVALTAGSAGAASISYSNTYGPTSVGSAPFDISLPKFDPLLGTLQSVTLTLDANTDSGESHWTNTSGIGGTITLGIGAEVEATAPAALTVVAVPMQYASGTVGVGDSFSVVGGVGSDSDSATLNSGLGTYIAGFLGETFDVGISSIVQTYLTTSGPFGPNTPIPGNTDGLVTVTYVYEPVPEPSTVVLGLFGLAGLAVAVARRRK